MTLDPEALVGRVATACRDAYVQERTRWDRMRTSAGGHSRSDRLYNPGPKWDGGDDQRGHTHTPIWPRIAKFALRHNLDPYRMTAIRFGIARGEHPPFPNQIPIETHLEVYRSGHTPISVRDAELDKSSEMQRCAMEIVLAMDGLERQADRRTACRSVLFNELLPLSPLLRYSLALAEGFDDIADAYEVAAALQYAQAPDVYIAVWGNLIPEIMRSSVSHLFASASIGGSA